MGNDCQGACNVCKNSETVIDATSFPNDALKQHYENSKNMTDYTVNQQIQS